jgi:hypothetical protein
VPVGLACSGRRTATRRWCVCRLTGGHGAKVGSHLYGRFCRNTPTPTARWPRRDSGRLQISGRGFPPNPGGLLNAPQRPSHRPSAMTCCFFASLKTFTRRRLTLFIVLVLGLSPLAAFQMITIGRIWVITEVIDILGGNEEAIGYNTEPGAPLRHTSQQCWSGKPMWLSSLFSFEKPPMIVNRCKVRKRSRDA